MSIDRMNIGKPLLLLPLALFVLPACQQKMANQPYKRPLEQSDFYPDGRSARPWVQGAVSFNQRGPADPLNTGLTAQGREARPRKDESAIPAGAPDDVGNYVSAFPFTITADDLKRGAERYTIFCVPCHGMAGDGKGKIWERGYLKPTNFHAENSRGFGRYRKEVAMSPAAGGISAPVGYYFEVISRGYGGMPDYSQQISPEDRWRIIAYIRALQLSQAASLNDLPQSVRDAARAEADKAATEPAKQNGGQH